MQVKFEMNLITHKLMKKQYGKYLGREIAIGRKLIKELKEIYKPKII